MAPPAVDENTENNGRTQIVIDATTMVSDIAGGVALNNALTGIPFFDGRNMPLKDFIQDIRNGYVFVENQQGTYVKALLGRLIGTARDSTYGKKFSSVEELIAHLIKRFAPGKDYSYYASKINSLRMKQTQTVGDFYDQMNILLSGARGAIDTDTPRVQGETAEARQEKLDLSIRPLLKTALDQFIKGLPGDMARQVDSIRPKDIEEAYDEAVRLETRMDLRILPDTRRNFKRSGNYSDRGGEYAPRNNYQNNSNQGRMFPIQQQPGPNNQQQSEPNQQHRSNNNDNQFYQDNRQLQPRERSSFNDPRLFNHRNNGGNQQNYNSRRNFNPDFNQDYNRQNYQQNRQFQNQNGYNNRQFQNQNGYDNGQNPNYYRQNNNGRNFNNNGYNRQRNNWQNYNGQNYNNQGQDQNCYVPDQNQGYRNHEPRNNWRDNSDRQYNQQQSNQDYNHQETYQHLNSSGARHDAQMTSQENRNAANQSYNQSINQNQPPVAHLQQQAQSQNNPHRVMQILTKSNSTTTGGLPLVEELQKKMKTMTLQPQYD